jgi:uncharacterized surface protein with fasciclin (FAS1) repeats
MKSLLLALTVVLSLGTARASDIIDTARANGNFTTLLTALSLTGLDKALEGAGPFTVFAPTDDAFAKLPAGTLDVLIANPEVLKGILLFHVAAGEFPAKKLLAQTTVTTLQGDRLALFATPKAVQVANGRVVKADIKTSNGIIHVVDQVLLPSTRSVEAIKADIVALAKTFLGQGDADFSRQIALQTLVAELLSVKAQAPVSDRLPLIRGCWKQVWGPYEYRNNSRGVDPMLGVDEIYQCVFDGHYYNVSRQYRGGDRSRPYIGLLRGKYVLSHTDANGLDVRFTKLFSVKNSTTQVTNIYDLPPFAEAGRLQNRLRTLPAIFVRLFFGGGTLRELYTDENVRILLGANDTEFKNNFIYVMTRVK